MVGEIKVPSNKRDLKREAYWQEIIDKQKQSGKSQTQFCRDENITDHKFCYWKSALAKRQKAKKPTQLPDNKINIPFVPLNVQSNFDFTNNQNTEQIEISKIILRISANTDESTLACILQSLGA
jgi:hypothetical protein